MTPFRIVREAWQSLRAAPQRSMLALLGIGVGIGSVIAMVTIGASARAQSDAEFRALGTDLFTIELDTDEMKVRPLARVAALEGVGRTSGAVRVISAVARIEEVPNHRGKALEGTRSLGVSEAFFDVSRARVKQGRLLSRLDGGRRFCVIGAAVVENLAAAGTREPVGASLSIGDRTYTVIGTLARAPKTRLTPYKVDESVMVPIEIATRASVETVSFAAGRLDTRIPFKVAVSRIERDMKAKNLEGSVKTAEELVQQAERQARLFTLLLGAIGTISLIVGGIGVMNVMLASVAERRKEIGLLRALGARRSTVQAQFAAEALLLGVMGGSLGIAAGLAAARLVCRVSHWPFLWSPGGILTGGLLAIAISVFFGSFPARQAARIHPMTALR